MHQNGVGAPTINGTVSALRYLFTVNLRQRDLSRWLVITRLVVLGALASLSFWTLRSKKR